MSTKRSNRFREWLVLVASTVGMGLLAGSAHGGAQERLEQSSAPWWKQEKIIFMWGQWEHARVDKSSSFWYADLPRELFRRVARAGGTVFVQTRGHKPNHARYAQEFGLKYFATLFVTDLSGKVGDRKWLKADKQHWWPCPLDQATYERWIVEPHLADVREGLIDGIHFDWEAYAGRGEAGICYCDDCFGEFLEQRGSPKELPAKLERLNWLTDRDLAGPYETNFHVRRVEMFNRIRKQLQAAKPDLLFSSYNMLDSDFSQGMHTSEVPFIICDARHYANDNRQAWWESYATRLQQLGYLYIPGGWVNALFGAQPSDVGAARWIYEAAINKDGCWLWFERELDDEILRAYSTADRHIKAVQGKVGQFLFNGDKDLHFVTAVEWSGNPQLEGAAVHQTYHLDSRHLVHVNNVNSDWPIRVRLRFGNLPTGTRWTLGEAMAGLAFSRDGGSDEWSAADLREGVVVALDPRTDVFLLLTPASAGSPPEFYGRVFSRDYSALPEHDVAAAAAAPVKPMLNLYVMDNAVFGQSLEQLLPTAQKIVDLPAAGWMFRMDRDDMGPGEKWFLPDTPLEGWIEIEIEEFWGSKGGHGAGWYRTDVDVPEHLPQDKRVYLYFGAVDEELVLWIDGEYAGDYKHPRGPDEGWDKPFAIDVTDKLTGGKHHLALRVYNSLAAGGVWKPVSVLAGPVVDGGDAPAAEPASANSGPAGRLVYTATEPLGFDGPSAGFMIGNSIRVVEADDGSQMRVRQLRGHLWSPAFSPDGTRIMYVHHSGGRGQICTMNPDGTDATNLSGNDFCDRSPAWSPDGAKIAFVSDRDSDWEIYVMNADGSNPRRLTFSPGVDRAPAWSPDGMRIAWESTVNGMPNIWVCEVDGGDPAPLIRPDRPVTLKATAPGEDPWSVEPLFEDNTLFLMDPIWSPDGRHIAATSLKRAGQAVAVVTTDGSSLTWTSAFPGIGEICWSPDGTRIAGAFRCGPQETEWTGIFVVSADGSDEQRIVDATPIGPRLGGAQRGPFLTWYSHGSAQPRRTVKTFSFPCWSPDGTVIAFSSDMDESGAFYVYTVDASGGESNRLDGTKSAWPNELHWHP